MPFVTRALFAGLFATLLVPSISTAQTLDPTRVGCVNLSYVAQHSQIGKAGMARIEAAAAKKSVDLDARAAEVRKEQAALNSIGLSERARVDLQRTFDKARVELERLQEDARSEVNAMQEAFRAEFEKAVAPVIEEVSKERNLQFVFGLEQAAIVWFNPAVDISEDVVKRLDARK